MNQFYPCYGRFNLCIQFETFGDRLDWLSKSHYYNVFCVCHYVLNL